MAYDTGAFDESTIPAGSGPSKALRVEFAGEWHELSTDPPQRKARPAAVRSPVPALAGRRDPWSAIVCIADSLIA